MMPTVFLVGDSIRLGYQEHVARELASEAIVVSSDDNARFTTYTFRYLHEWARLCPDPGTVSVVHWNNGLWDACHWNDDELALVPLDVYRINLSRIRRALSTLFPNAKILFATTTKVGVDHPRVRNTEIDSMNEVAREVLEPLDVGINDLHGLVAAHPEYICSDQTHMTVEGYCALGKAVADSIRPYLV